MKTGTLKYLQSSFNDDNQAVKITEPRIYFGLQTNDAIAINSKDNTEYDYPISSTKSSYNTYNGEAGVTLGFFDRLVLGIKEGNIKLAFSKNISNDSNIIIKRPARFSRAFRPASLFSIR